MECDKKVKYSSAGKSDSKGKIPSNNGKVILGVRRGNSGGGAGWGGVAYGGH